MHLLASMEEVARSLAFVSSSEFVKLKYDASLDQHSCSHLSRTFLHSTVVVRSNLSISISIASIVPSDHWLLELWKARPAAAKLHQTWHGK